MALITIGGMALPDPSSYDAKVIDIVDNGRNSQGVYVGNVIRSNVANVEARWNFLTLDQWASILSLFNGTFERQVTFLDMVSGAYVSRNMYIGDRTGAMCSYDPHTHAARGWRNCRLLLTEV